MSRWGRNRKTRRARVCVNELDRREAEMLLTFFFLHSIFWLDNYLLPCSVLRHTCSVVYVGEKHIVVCVPVSSLWLAWWLLDPDDILFVLMSKLHLLYISVLSSGFFSIPSNSLRYGLFLLRKSSYLEKSYDLLAI